MNFKFNTMKKILFVLYNPQNEMLEKNKTKRLFL